MKFYFLQNFPRNHYIYTHSTTNNITSDIQSLKICYKIFITNTIIKLSNIVTKKSLLKMIPTETCKTVLPFSCQSQDFIGTSQLTLGVLFFPLIPLATKGTHTRNQRTIAPRLASQGRSSTVSTSLVSQLSQVKHNPQNFGSITLPRKVKY
jgi:hypothetical protein